MKNANLFSLKGRNIFVVGGLGTLGLVAAQALADAGARTIILDIDKGAAAKILKGAWKNRLILEYFDACDLNSCEASLQRLVKKYGPLHGLVNVSYPRSRDWTQPLEKMTIGYLRENVDKHLNSYLWISRAAALLMQKTKIKGSLINFGSIYGVVANDLTVYEGTPLYGEMTYSAIKGGIANMTRYLASHFGKSGIRVNCISPGGIFEGQHPVFVKKYEHKVPLKRMGVPQDIAGAVVFLTAEASSYITGAVLMVDGGWTAI